MTRKALVDIIYLVKGTGQCTSGLLIFCSLKYVKLMRLSLLFI